MQLGFVILYVPDVPATMAFYKDAFALSDRFMTDGGDYGEMETGQTKLAFASEALASSHGFDFERRGPDSNPGAFEIALVCDDVEAAFKNALECGARALAKPKQMPWGQLVGYVADINGNTVEICSPVGAPE